jgi:hypothetical protein
LSLERHTANQAITATDIRYQLVLNTLAKLAASPGDLPGLGTVTDGTAAVTDQANLDLKTALDGVTGFTGETVSGGVTRSPNLQWTIDTAYNPDQINAARAACRWVLTGEYPQDIDVVRLLKLFQVHDDLVCLNAHYPGWFCTGCRSDVPKSACYVAQYCGKYLWVTAEGIKGLSEFTLILADIATISPASLYGSAVVSLTQPIVTPAAPAGPAVPAATPPPRGPLTQQTVLFRYSDAKPGEIDFAGPVVVYGVPNQKHFGVNWPEMGWCDAIAHPDTAHEVRANIMKSRPLPPAGPNPSFNYRLRQQQQEMQTQSFLGR